jgi:hypothetical protein
MRLVFCSTYVDALEHLSRILYRVIWQYKCYWSNSDPDGITAATGKTSLVQQPIDGLSGRGSDDHSGGHGDCGHDTWRDSDRHSK